MFGKLQKEVLRQNERFKCNCYYRGSGRYEKLVVLLFTDPTKNVGGAKGCLLCKLQKVGGAIAPPAPPVPPPLYYFANVIKIIPKIHTQK